MKILRTLLRNMQMTIKEYPCRTRENLNVYKVHHANDNIKYYLYGTDITEWLTDSQIDLKNLSDEDRILFKMKYNK